jgi:hypothetical protein
VAVAAGEVAEAAGAAEGEAEEEAEEVAERSSAGAAVEVPALAVVAAEDRASAEVEWAAGRAVIWAAAAVIAHFRTAATSARAAATLRVEVITSHKAARIGATEDITAAATGFLSAFRSTTTAIMTPDTTVAVAAGFIAVPSQPGTRTGGVATNCAKAIKS